MSDYLSRLLDRQWRGETPIRPRSGSMFESAPPQMLPDSAPAVPEPAADRAAAIHEPAPAPVVPPAPAPVVPSAPEPQEPASRRSAPDESPPAHDSAPPTAGQQRPAATRSSVESPQHGERLSTAEVSAPENAGQDIAEQPVFQQIRRTVIATETPVIEPGAPDRPVTDATETQSADERLESARVAKERREIPSSRPRAIRVAPDSHPPFAVMPEPAEPGGAESEPIAPDWPAPSRPAPVLRPSITAAPDTPPPGPAAQPPVIRVTIGRIEVRAVAPTERAKPAPQRRRLSLSLDDYLKQRGGR